MMTSGRVTYQTYKISSYIARYEMQIIARVIFKTICLSITTVVNIFRLFQCITNSVNVLRLLLMYYNCRKCITTVANVFQLSLMLGNCW